MFDTIVLNIPQENFKVWQYHRFSPSAKGFFEYPTIKMGSQGFVKAVCNPNKAEKQSGYYYPNLTLRKAVRAGGYEIFLSVQFSAAKILFGNNFDEPSDAQLDELVSTLKNRLFDMGVQVSLDSLKNAKVSSIHYAKNVALTDHSLPFDYISKLGKIEQSLWRDIADVSYGNGGSSFKLHTNAWELIIYDKRKDLEQAKRSEKKSINRDNYSQLSLFEEVPKGLQFEVLRIELRLNSARVIWRNLEDSGISRKEVPDLTLVHLFDELIAMKLLARHIELLESKFPAFTDNPYIEARSLLTSLRIGNPKVKLETLLAAVAYSQLLTELGGVRDVKSILGQKGSNQWTYLVKKMNKLEINTTKPKPFIMLTESIISGDKLRLKDYILEGKDYEKGDNISEGIH